MHLGTKSPRPSDEGVFLPASGVGALEGHDKHEAREE